MYGTKNVGGYFANKKISDEFFQGKIIAYQCYEQYSEFKKSVLPSIQNTIHYLTSKYKTKQYNVLVGYLKKFHEIKTLI